MRLATMFRSLIPLMLVLPMSLGASAQQGVRPDGVYSSTASAVIVDVVVRGADGRPLTDLTAADFRVYEDDVLQEISTFGLVSRGVGVRVGVRAPRPQVAAAGPGAPATPPAPDEPSVFAVVFDRMSADARARAQRAALRYVYDNKHEDDRVGVFSVESTLRVLQGYTDDSSRIAKGLELASVALATPYQSQMDAIHRIADRTRQLDRELGSLGALGGQGAAATGSSAVGRQIGSILLERALAQTERTTLESLESLERDHHGTATTNALLAVVSGLGVMPGRKTLILFSEGVPLPTGADLLLKSVIDTANRANVSIYAMDASGLRVNATTAQARADLASTAQDRLLNEGREPEGSLTRLLERNEDLLRSDPHGMLSELADQTGGFLIRDTNDLGSGFRRIEEDMRMHYVLTYAPKNDNFDGKFRRLDVRVGRRGARVFARRGYFAVRAPGPSPILGHETAALAAFDRTPWGNEFPVHAAALSFPSRSRPGLSTLLVATRTNGLAYLTDAAARTFSADAVVLVRVRDKTGRIVAKVSQHYALSGPAADIENSRRGEILFYREVTLDPGVYTVQAGVYDAVGQRSSVRTSTLEVPAAQDEALALSSLVLVGRTERVKPEERVDGHPLYVGDLLLYPNLDASVSKAAHREVPFYFVIQPAGRSDSLQASLELVAGQQLLAEMPVPLGSLEPDGRVATLARLPLDPLPPGTYELRLTVRAGPHVERRRAAFVLAP